MEALGRLSGSLEGVRSELSRIIVGQEDVIEQLLIAMLAGGHCLLVGVPGLAKTLTIASLAQAISLDFSRIQFTPDLMPADITGSEVIEEDRSTGRRQFRFLPGPIFANVVLADEVNRTPPKTQAALLEAMQERQVTVGGQRHPLPSPFFVLATQNPIEQEGTYPLPEAQLDRFMLNIVVDYPEQDDEIEVVLRTTGSDLPKCQSQLTGEQLIEMSDVVRRIATTRSLATYATMIARATRPSDPTASPTVRRCVRWGAGPRASQQIVLGAKARAALQGSPIVRREDIQALALPVLRHRMRLNFQAETEGVRLEELIASIVDEVGRNTQDGEAIENASKVLRS
ncbi:MAG TPA: AAA family ATPase [Planctomycetaceae bacterium]|nr:AAA family ATPase [Planctomycetaceae bacterium]